MIAANVHRPLFPALSLQFRLLLHRSITNGKIWEYAGVGLALIGWLGVRQLGDLRAVAAGLVLWVASAAIITAWGYRTGARGIALQNAVNLIMATSALIPLIMGAGL